MTAPFYAEDDRQIWHLVREEHDGVTEPLCHRGPFVAVHESDETPTTIYLCHECRWIEQERREKS